MTFWRPFGTRPSTFPSAVNHISTLSRRWRDWRFLPQIQGASYSAPFLFLRIIRYSGIRIHRYRPCLLREPRQWNGGATQIRARSACCCIQEWLGLRHFSGGVGVAETVYGLYGTNELRGIRRFCHRLLRLMPPLRM